MRFWPPLTAFARSAKELAFYRLIKRHTWKISSQTIYLKSVRNAMSCISFALTSERDLQAKAEKSAFTQEGLIVPSTGIPRMSSLVGMETMDRSSYLMRTTTLFSLLVILFGTVGVLLLHPAHHHQGEGSAPLTCSPTHFDSKTISLIESEGCSICQFLASFQPCGEDPPAQKARFRPVCEVPNPPALGFSQRICFLLFDARAPPNDLFL